MKHIHKTMKSTVLVAFVLLLFAFSQSSDASPKQVVIDTSGKKLRADANYYIIPAKPFTICGFVSCFTGGGIALDAMNNIDDDESNCPLDVVVVKHNQGLPLRFTPFNSKKGVIHVNTDLNIKFSDSDDSDFDSRCSNNHSKVWKLEDRLFDDSKGSQTIVTIGGVMGNPGLHTIQNLFKVEKYIDDDDGAYKLVYCPSVCSSCNHVCKDVGVFVDGNRQMHLALSDVPFKIKFQKA